MGSLSAIGRVIPVVVVSVWDIMQYSFHSIARGYIAYLGPVTDAVTQYGGVVPRLQVDVICIIMGHDFLVVFPQRSPLNVGRGMITHPRCAIETWTRVSILLEGVVSV